ncbi:LacI family transcriptional regulator [Cohnella sp. CIP 111063]|jgi:LacI family transcriptional regulator|uniref:LacI family DNA-binding transcriptional regulator n=1 Tax=unclassified Cohnella TaxID=2636738 RepID=UPI000B8BF0AF|nr:MULTISPECIES: LacI family DNA-binding transcriptional regulator [unclassified Cohnella]OXS61809.1 LacI family transcriptional regulator [Cohnella sp. CIP 111063]
MTLTNRKEVAKLAGVSEATVSRVLNGIGPMKESTRERVLQAAKQLNYELNAVASSFARGRSGNLGVVLPHVPKVHLFSTYYFSELLGGIGEAVHSRGYGLLLLFRDPTSVYDYVSLYRTQRVDACIILGSSAAEEEKQAVHRLADERLPFCVMDQRFDHPLLNIVAADHEQGSYDAVKHLIGKGYRRIGFLNGAPQYSNSRDRMAGYRRALLEAGIAEDDTLVYEGNYSRTSGRRAASLVHRDLGRLDAIFVGNDRMAIGLMQGLRELGCSLPDDLKIVAYDDSDAASFTEPPLTTVRVPFYEMGRLAADRLLTQLADKDKSDAPAALIREKLPTELVIRKSSGN